MHRNGNHAFAAVTAAIVVMLAGSNLPTPLYPVYQRVFGLTPLPVTLVFGTYASPSCPACRCTVRSRTPSAAGRCWSPPPGSA